MSRDRTLGYLIAFVGLLVAVCVIAAFVCLLLIGLVVLGVIAAVILLAPLAVVIGFVALLALGIRAIRS